MAIDYQKLKAWSLPEIEHRYDQRDTILYALSVGFGFDPVDERQLRFVYEKELLAAPTMGVVLGHPGFWVMNPGTGVDWKRVLHGEQHMIMHHPPPPAGVVVGRTRIDEIIDKGPDKGALIYSTRDVVDKETGRLLCSCVQSTYCRGDGGFGGPGGPTLPVHVLPDRKPDLQCDLPTLPQSALLYRLNGDWNPMHADPDVARAANFSRPILHGLCTFGVAGHALMRALCDYDPDKLGKIQVRFSGPVLPGETIRTEIWRESESRAGFRCRVVERDAVVINNGLVELNN